MEKSKQRQIISVWLVVSTKPLSYLAKNQIDV